MTRNVSQPPKLKIMEEEIQPWNVQDSTQLNIIQSTTSRYYQPVNRHTISFNPQNTLGTQNKTKKSLIKNHNFFDNLRKYESKKADQQRLKSNKNFIGKNKQKLIEDFILESQESQTTSMLGSDLFTNKKTIRNIEQKLSSRVQPINWSLIMYYQSQQNRRKPNHKDIQSFLRFQSQRKEMQKERLGTRENSLINQENLNKNQDKNVQKRVKLKEGIRMRHLKSASSTSKVQRNQPPIDQLRHSQHFHRTYGFIQFQKKMIPKTSNSARVSNKKKPIACKIQIIGNNNALIAKKQPLSELRTIHSSQRSSRVSKLLNINGTKVQNSIIFNNNI